MVPKNPPIEKALLFVWTKASWTCRPEVTSFHALIFMRILYLDRTYKSWCAYNTHRVHTTGGEEWREGSKKCPPTESNDNNFTLSLLVMHPYHIISNFQALFLQFLWLPFLIFLATVIGWANEWLGLKNLMYDFDLNQVKFKEILGILPLEWESLMTRFRRSSINLSVKCQSVQPWALLTRSRRLLKAHF